MFHFAHGQVSGQVSSTPLTDDTIREAVTAWCDDPVSAAGVYGNISDWNTSQVTDMEFLFSINSPDKNRPYCFGDTTSGGITYETFQDDISKWDVSRVKTMKYMFFLGSTFNGDISAWNVSSLKFTHQMFSANLKFNRDLSAWDVSRVEGMAFMFAGASSFDQHLCWDVSPSTITTRIFHKTSGACFNKTCGSVLNNDLYC